MSGRVTLLSCCALALTIAGCGNSSESSTSSNAGSGGTKTTAPKPTVRFVTPDPNAKLAGAVKVKVALTNFRIAPQAVGQAPRPGEGHLHFRMDGGKFDFPKYSGKNGLIAKKLGVTGHYSPALTPAITYRNLPPGRHSLTVYLANNNHTNVGIQKTLKFVVQ